MSTQDPNRVEVAARRLRRLETFLDVVYAVLFVHFIMYLPKTEDMAWMQLPWGLLSLLIDNRVELLRLFIAVGLTLISWNLTHKLLSPLQRTDGLHTICTLVQLVFGLPVSVLCRGGPDAQQRLFPGRAESLPRDVGVCGTDRLEIRATSGSGSRERLGRHPGSRGTQHDDRTANGFAQHRSCLHGSCRVDRGLVRTARDPDRRPLLDRQPSEVKGKPEQAIVGDRQHANRTAGCRV